MDKEVKKNRVIYWIATGLAVLLGAGTSPMYFNSPTLVEAFQHLGFPDYFRIELGIGKIIGAIILLLPRISVRIKEWVYAAFAITFISGSIAHGIVDGMPTLLVPLVPLIFLIISYIYYHKIQIESF